MISALLIVIISSSALVIFIRASNGNNTCAANYVEMKTSTIKSRWAIIALTLHSPRKSKQQRDMDKRNNLLVKKLRPYAQYHDITFIFFSEHDIPANVVQGWRNLFKSVGNVQYVNTYHLGFNNKKKFGYKYMCKFYSLDVYNLLKDYDYYMRCDSDCFIEQLEYDMLQWFENHDGGYGFASRKIEAHNVTVKTMPPWIENYMSSCSITPASLMGYSIDVCFNFYNNWHIAKVSFFNRPDVQHFLKSVNSSGNFVNLRWGDSTVQAYAVRLFMDTDQILQVPNFTYLHGSHNYRTSTYIGNNATWSDKKKINKRLPFWKNTYSTT